MNNTYYQFDDDLTAVIQKTATMNEPIYEDVDGLVDRFGILCSNCFQFEAVYWNICNDRKYPLCSTCARMALENGNNNLKPIGD